MIRKTILYEILYQFQKSIKINVINSINFRNFTLEYTNLQDICRIHSAIHAVMSTKKEQKKLVYFILSSATK